MQWYYILLILIGITVFLIAAGYFFLKIFASKYMAAIPTEELMEGVFAINNDYVNCFIYRKDTSTILVDAGTSVKAVEKELQKLEINPKSITHVFLTHGDMDHIGAVPLFSKAKFYLGKGSKIKNPEDYEFLNDGKIVEIGSIWVTAIDTPGHRKGHTAYLVDGKYLFTGDAIKLKEGKAKPFIRLISSDYKTQLESIKKIAQMKGIEALFTAHTGFTENFDEAVKEWQ